MAKNNLISRAIEAVKYKIEREAFVKECFGCEYTVRQLAEALYDIIEEQAKKEEEIAAVEPIAPITISQEEFAKHFKIAGYKSIEDFIAGKKTEGRGRPRKNKDTEIFPENI